MNTHLTEMNTLQHAQFERFVPVGGPLVAAVDAIARYGGVN